MNSQKIWDFLYLALYNDPDSYDNNANWKTMIDNKRKPRQASTRTQ